MADRDPLGGKQIGETVGEWKLVALVGKDKYHRQLVRVVCSVCEAMERTCRAHLWHTDGLGRHCGLPRSGLRRSRKKKLGVCRWCPGALKKLATSRECVSCQRRAERNGRDRTGFPRFKKPYAEERHMNKRRMLRGVQCSACSAEAGEPCRSKLGKPIKKDCHEARRRAACAR